VAAVANPAGLSGSNTHTGAHARLTPLPDPLAELKGDLAAILKFLEATRTPVVMVLLGRRRGNRFGHAMEAMKRELRRALEATGAGGAGPG
jgi:hypothetical protein